MGLPGASAQSAACPGPAWRRDASSEEGEWVCGVDTSGWLVLSLQLAETFTRPGGLHLRGDQLMDKDSPPAGGGCGREGRSRVASPAGSAKEAGKSGCFHSMAFLNQRFTLTSSQHLWL